MTGMNYERGDVTGQVLDSRGAKDLSDQNNFGAVPFVYRFDIEAGANADKDIIVGHKIRVIDAMVVLQGAGVSSAVLTVKNGSTAITDGMVASGSDKAIVRAATLDDAQWEVAAGGTLRVTGSAGATQPDATVLVTAVRVA